MNRRWQIHPQDPATARSLGVGLGIHPALAQILINRGIKSTDAAQRFLAPELKGLANPMALPGLEGAAERLAEAIIRRRKIGIYGDYDADGITSVALFSLVLGRLGVKPAVYIPNRLTDGYGLNETGLRTLAAAGVEVLVTADCGTTDYEQAALAGRLGMELILTDHHQLGPEPPPAEAFVNPCSLDTPSEFKGLAGVGVIFFLLVGLRMKLREKGFFNGGREPNLKEFMDLVALGTIADVSPMVGQNRLLVKTGLDLLAERPRPGLAALARAARLGRSLTARDILFGLAPRINAPGRLGPADIALELLLAPDRDSAAELAAAVDRLNARRQRIEREVLKLARRQLEAQGDPRERMAIVAAGQGWHQGVLGIVASRLSRLYNRPSFALSIDETTAVGSGRSIEAVHLHRCLERLTDHLIRFGGHSQAAGLTLPTEGIDAFARALEVEVGRTLAGADLTPTITVDAALDLDDLSYDLLDDLERLAPFGPGNPEPVFAAERVGLLAGKAVGKDGAHLSLSLRQGQKTWPAIGFDLGRRLEELPPSARVAFRPFADTFRGRQQIKLQVLDIQPA